MSRIGKAPIILPEGVQVTVGDGNIVTAKGPKGELSMSMDPDSKLNITDGVVSLERPTEQKRHKSLT
jgi:large subunit ribosomal protein L6